MYIIKRYSNRKMYDTVQKRYITLREIADLVARGEEIKVIDNASGQDITSLTLSQVIYEQEKRENGHFPKTLLSDLIQKGGDFLERLPRSIHNFFHPGQNNLEQVLENWVREGVIEARHIHRVTEDIYQIYNREWIQQMVEEVMAERSLPTQKEVEKLKKLIIILEKLVDEKVL